MQVQLVSLVSVSDVGTKQRTDLRHVRNVDEMQKRHFQYRVIRIHYDINLELDELLDGIQNLSTRDLSM